MECGAPVGGGTIAFACDLPLPRGHDGPCRAIENVPSVERRKRWEAAQLALQGDDNPMLVVVAETDQQALRVRPGDQPLPIPNDRGSIQDSVIKDIQARRDLGIRRYGTPLQAYNGRDALYDAYEEALDLACYLKQAIVERDGASGPK